MRLEGRDQAVEGGPRVGRHGKTVAVRGDIVVMTEDPTLLPVPEPPTDLPAVDGEYEYRVLMVPRGTPRAEVWRLLTDHAEYGRWELARVRLSFGGRHQIWLRRRIIRVVRTA
jgi:hypothetical protein